MYMVIAIIRLRPTRCGTIIFVKSLFTMFLSHEQINCLDALFFYLMVSQYPLHLNVFEHLKSNIRNYSL